MVLSTEYFPTVEFFAVAAQNSTVFLEAHESYRKQTYRNRCTILSANGKLDLNFPIVHDGSSLITDIKVDYSTPWVAKTQRAICSAYDSSPFFEYYKDAVFAVLDSRPEKLWDLDLALIRLFAAKLGLSVTFRPTDSFLGETYVISPKVPSGYEGKEYYQVFGQKFGFVPGLSVMDLLFNEGPNSLCIIE